MSDVSSHDSSRLHYQVYGRGERIRVAEIRKTRRIKKRTTRLVNHHEIRGTAWMLGPLLWSLHLGSSLSCKAFANVE